jgi:hypothetical protein
VNASGRREVWAVRAERGEADFEGFAPLQGVNASLVPSAVALRLCPPAECSIPLITPLPTLARAVGIDEVVLHTFAAGSYT